MTDIVITRAATSLAPGRFRTVEAVVARHAVAPVPAVQGTGLPIAKCGGAGLSARTLKRTRLPFASVGAYLGALGTDGVMGADQVQGTVVRIPAVTDQGDPPRRTPSRC